MSRKIKPEDLYDNIITEATIDCTKCKKETGHLINIDEYESAKHFFKNGWRATYRYTYCPKCAKKHLRQ